MYDLILKQGTIVSSERIVVGDIAIENGKIREIAPCINAPSKETLDVSGQFVFPGVIDVHVHLSEPGTDFEGFTFGTQMLAAGGCTTYFDMPINGQPPTTTEANYAIKKELADEKSIIDYKLWAGLTPNNFQELSKLAKVGAIGFKAFLSEIDEGEFCNVDDISLLEGMAHIAKLHKILALHAESGPMTNFLTKKSLSNQQVTADAYLQSRPIEAEVEAVGRALTYASLTNCPLHFVHISSYEAVQAIHRAKEAGQDVTLETCPHYLLFNHTAYEKHGHAAKCAPPLRAKEHQMALRQAVKEGLIDIISSDHSPCLPHMKKSELHAFDAWGGINGGQFTLQAMLQFADEAAIEYNEIAKMLATNPARRFGLVRKGDLAIGYEADLVIVEKTSLTITKENLYTKHKQSLYLHHTFHHQIVRTYSKGTVVYHNPSYLS